MISKKDLSFLKTLVAATTNACRMPAGVILPDRPRNDLPFTVIQPGGHDGYPAVWIQDFTMIFSGGSVTLEEGQAHLRLILQCQNSPAGRSLASGAYLPPHAIADHINFNGTPVFFPGTYSAGEDQGGEPWGITPPHNNHFDVIWLAHLLMRLEGNADFLRRKINGLSMYQRLRLAYEVPTCDPETGVVYTTAEKRAVGFIFCDSIYMTGSLLMASLLRIRASGHMAELADALGHPAQAAHYRKQAALTTAHIVPVFAGTGPYEGWLKASTGVSGQPDVWGTIYSLYKGVVKGEARERLIQTLLTALREGDIEFEGALRHVPLRHNASATSAWEKALTGFNSYQNGAFWHMPTGWLIAVLEEDHPREAKALAQRYLKHLRAQAFTRGPGFSAPWECIGWEGKANRVPIFGPSVTVPYSVLANVYNEREGRTAL